MRAWILVVLAACYAPAAPEGVACGDLDVCPSGQHCYSGVCLRRAPGSEVDAGTDDVDGSPDPDADVDASIATNDDRDGDGVLNAADNCPDRANQGQENEDGDGLGDACDPCPIDTNNADADGDGIGDACDPDPNMPGNQLVLFEGFHHGMPANWQVVGGSTSQAGDDLRFVAPAHTEAVLFPTAIGTHARVKISAQITVTELVGQNDNGGIGLATEFNSTFNPGGGVPCELYADLVTNASSRDLSLYDIAADHEIGYSNLAWQLNTPYVVSELRNDQNYTCSAGGATTGGVGAAQPAAANHPAFDAYSSTTKLGWVLIVTKN